MLKGIPNIISPELLKILDERGHGDEIVIGDGNFPAASNAQRLIRCDGQNVPELLDAILKLSLGCLSISTSFSTFSLLKP